MRTISDFFSFLRDNEGGATATYDDVEDAYRVTVGALGDFGDEAEKSQALHRELRMIDSWLDVMDVVAGHDRIASDSAAVCRLISVGA
jgi:hypothetical protein